MTLLTTDPHPYYGPCDSILPDGGCAECQAQRVGYRGPIREQATDNLTDVKSGRHLRIEWEVRVRRFGDDGIEEASPPAPAFTNFVALAKLDGISQSHPVWEQAAKLAATQLRETIERQLEP